MQVRRLPKLQGQQRLVVLFSTGEELIHSLAEVAKTRSILGAHFTGIGALRAAMLGFFDIARREYRRFGIDEQVEVLSLMGNNLHGGWRAPDPRPYRGGALQRRHPGRSPPRGPRPAHSGGRARRDAACAPPAVRPRHRPRSPGSLGPAAGLA